MHCNYCGNDLTNTSPMDSYRLRRSDSRFCDDQCKDLYHRAKRKLERKLARMKQLRGEIFDLKRELQWDTAPDAPVPANQDIDDPENKALLEQFFNQLVGERNE